ncbi:MAG: aminotransferase class V-fold PLP-dependent enzyme [Anaerolineales bacterium]|nr:aminotransferase class V-fold PLP-dependent enzyme [Anaerolineales bacterium]
MPLLDGSWAPYINLDNAASTPPFRRVREKVDEAMEVYASIHRGAGFKSLLSTHLYDKARQVVADFVGADQATQCVIFVKNATEAINKLANRFPFQPGDLVLTSMMEHHSNDLPWRARCKVLYAGLLPDGSLDVDDLTTKLRQNAGKIKLVAITGASNVTGTMPPIYEIAELAHQYGARILVDCAQLLPHRPIDMGPSDSPRHLDFIAFSAHKVYAPFGSGGLIGPKDFFEEQAPDYVGGGTVEIVTLDEVQWTQAPERDEAGSPNVIGAVALAAALQQLNEAGMDALVEHEKALTREALELLQDIPGVRLFGPTDPNRLDDRLGVIPFELVGMPHAKLAAIMSYEGGIGLRNGCFCAHPYVLHLLNVSNDEYLSYRARVLDHDRSHLPGFVRASFGCYNTLEEVHQLADTLKRVSSGEVQGDYLPDRGSGSYYPRGFEMQQMDAFFTF